MAGPSGISPLFHARSPQHSTPASWWPYVAKAMPQSPALGLPAATGLLMLAPTAMKASIDHRLPEGLCRRRFPTQVKIRRPGHAKLPQP